jgi:peptide/nickel transport system permease protein
MPGDPIMALIGMKAPEATIDSLRRQFLLDQPIYIQYFDYLADLLRGDLGVSIYTTEPVIEEIMLRFPATVELAIAGTLVSVIVGLLTGAYSAHKHNTVIDHSFRLFSIIIYAFFIPWFGMILQMIFAVQLGWLPLSGRADVYLEPSRITGLYVVDSLLTLNFLSLVNSIKHLILPSIVLGLVLSGIYTRLTRTNMLDVLRQDFITAARARGLSERVVVYKHALKNAFIPILTMMGLQFALLLAGAVLTETTFSWNGIGTFLLQGIENRDYPIIQGIIVFYAVLVAFVSLIVDVVYAYIDPRIRFEEFS